MAAKKSDPGIGSGLSSVKKIADKGISTSLKKADVGINTAAKTAANNTTAVVGGGSGYSKTKSGGGGGGGGSSKKQTQAQITNQGDIYGKRAGDMAKNTQDYAKAMTDAANQRKGDLEKNAQAQLSNTEQAMQANDALLAENRRNIMQQISWQPNQQKEQSTMMALRNRIGNAALGSGLHDLLEGMSRIDDMNDVELVNTYKQNDNSAFMNWFQAAESLINDYNDQVAQIKESLSQFDYDYQRDLDKLRTDYNDESSKLNSQYWSTISNIDPQLASKANMSKAASNAGNTAAVTLAKEVQKLVKTGKITKGTKLTKAQQQANQILQNAQKKNKGKSAKAIQKAANKAADNAVTKATKATKVSANGYTLPNVNLNRTVNWGNGLNATSDALQKMLVAKENASATNPRTAAYVRPDYAKGDVLTGDMYGQTSQNSGNINTSRAANTGFSDNLAAFRRV